MTLTLAHLFPHFDTLIQTPADLQRLNQTILQLAVQGKLVPQDPQDEPASVLLERIATKREQLIAERRVDKARELPDVEPDDSTFPLPSGWVLARLGDLVSKLGAGSTPRGGKSVYQDEGIKFIRSQNVWNDGLRLDDVAYISEEINERMSNTVVMPMDILLNITGASIGRSSVVPDNFDIANVSQHVAIIRLIDPELRKFLHTCIIAPDTQKQIMDVQVGISREGLSMTNLQYFVVPLPPLAEQKRIVAKVDELLAQTRTLEAKLRRAAEAIIVVNRAVLHRVQTAPDTATFAHAVDTLRDHFDALTTDPRTLTDLRQTILQLAVQGKLVPQDPQDEPASVLLERIAAERERLVKEGKIKKEKPLLPVDEDDTPFELPIGWICTRLEQICYVGTGSTPRRDEAKYYENGTVSWVTSAVTGQPFITEPSEYITEIALKESNCTVYPKHSLVVALYGQGKTRGQVSELLIEAATNQACAVLVFDGFSDEVQPFVKIYFQKIYQELRSLAEGGAQPNLNVGKVKETIIPLPPLAEQKRIVAKVDELLARCDGLAAKLGAAQVAGGQLTAAVLAQVVG